jgi:hypothetical protein
VVPRAGLGAVVKRKIPSPYRDSIEPRSPQDVAVKQKIPNAYAGHTSLAVTDKEFFHRLSSIYIKFSYQ